MSELSMKEFLEAGVHFGHQRSRWNPKMKPYIFGVRDGVHIIDLQQTVDRCQDACNFVKSVTAQGKKVLFVGTKRQAQKIVRDQAERSKMFFITHRWLGGTLTNFKTVREGINTLKRIEDMEEKGIFKALKKKEVAGYKKQHHKLLTTFVGIRDMKKMPGALFIIDPNKEKIAVLEAKKLGIPIIAVVDTNCNPDNVEHVIPGNDDALKSIRLFSQHIADACLEGVQEFESNLRADDKKVEEEKEPVEKVSAMDVLSIQEAPVIVNPEEFDEDKKPSDKNPTSKKEEKSDNKEKK